MDKYISSFIINKKNYYCIWYTNDVDGFETDNNKLIYFSTLEDLHNYCKNMKIILQNSNVTFDNIDYFMHWLNHNLQEINCHIFLDFWNTIGDVAFSIKEHFYGNEDGKKNEIVDVYNRLFYGCNIEAVRKDGEMYYPTWDEEDMQIIKNVVKDGLRILSKALNIDLTKELEN